MAEPSEGWLDPNGKRWFHKTRDAVYACEAITSPTVLPVALLLVEYGADAFPSIATIARKTRLKERSVRNALRELEQARVITTRRTGRANHYSLFCNVQIPELGRVDDVPGGPKADEDPPSGVAPSSVSPDRHVVPIAPETARSARGADQRGTTCRSDRHVVPPKRGSKSNKRERRSARERAPAPPPALFVNFDGWECSPELRSEIIQLGIPAEQVDLRINSLKIRPINKGQGVTTLDGYVREQAQRWWVGWEAERLANAVSRGGNAVSSAFGGGGAAAAQTWAPAASAGRYCARWKLELSAEEAEFRRLGHHARCGGGRAADEAFKAWLIRRAKEEDQKRKTEAKERAA